MLRKCIATAVTTNKENQTNEAPAAGKNDDEAHESEEIHTPHVNPAVSRDITMHANAQEDMTVKYVGMGHSRNWPKGDHKSPNLALGLVCMLKNTLKASLKNFLYCTLSEIQRIVFC